MKPQIERAFALTILTLQLIILGPCKAQYEPPRPRIRALYPRGVHFSIPDEPGISLVAFHAKFNEDFNGLEAGTIARDIVRVKNGRWTYEDHSTRLKRGDKIYLWVHVVYDGLGYNLLDQILHVIEFYNYDGTLCSPCGEPSITNRQPSPSPPIDTGSNPTCFPSGTSYNGSNPCTKQLLFSDNFDQLETNKWRIVKQFSTGPDYEFVVYQGNEENLQVRDGELRVKPTLLDSQYNENFVRHGNLILAECTGTIGSSDCEKRARGFQILPPIVSGLIDTKSSFSFLYGRVEIRAKLPQGDWIYPIIKLLPVDNTYGDNYRSGELRIADTVGNRDLHDSTGMTWDGRILQAGAVISRYGSVRQNTMSRKHGANYWGDDYHVYELEWTQNSITVKVDGQQYDQKENPAAAHRGIVDTLNRWSSPNAPFDRLFYLSIGVGVGGLGQFPDSFTSGSHYKPWRNVEAKALVNFYSAKGAWANTWSPDASTLKVDYVKVWAL